MKKENTRFSERLFEAQPDFSLVLGGPLYQLLRKSRMSDETLHLVPRRVLTIALLAWLPLLILTAIDGSTTAGRVAVPFLNDVDVHVRFLIVVPLLILAELVVHQRLRFVVRQFFERRLVAEADFGRFEKALAAAYGLRNSVIAELLLALLVYGIGVSVVWRHFTALTGPTWYATPVPGGHDLTPGGYWYGYVSLPIFQFLLIRWYFRLFIWARFLWQVSRIELRLVPIHPDRLGGLGFLSNTVFAFAPLLVAHGAMLAGMIASRIFHLGASLPDFKLEVAVVVIFVLCLVFVPLLTFTPQLAQAKRAGLMTYGIFAEQCVRDFEAKWVRGPEAQGGSMESGGDIQSVSDLANTMEVVRSMLTVPVSRDAIIRLAAATLIPLVPLGLTMMPAAELAKRLLGILF